jgi:hypothetical protein
MTYTTADDNSTKKARLDFSGAGQPRYEESATMRNAQF